MVKRLMLKIVQYGSLNYTPYEKYRHKLYHAIKFTLDTRILTLILK